MNSEEIQKGLEEARKQIDNIDKQPIVIHILTPNEQLTKSFLTDVPNSSSLPDVYLNDWLTVKINEDQFNNNKQLLVFEEEPFRMGYDSNEYDISDVLAVNKPVFYQGISTTNGFSDEFINWLKDSCWNSVDENDLVNKLNNTIIPKLDKTTDKCIIRAARFDMPTPP